MTHLVFWIPFFLSICTAIAYVVSLRKAFAVDPSTRDVLTLKEYVMVTATLFFGGLIFPGSIYYFGLKDKFPNKRRTIRKIVWICFGLFLVFLAIAFYWAHTQSIARVQRVEDAVNAYKAAQLAQEQEQKSALTTQPLLEYQGEGYSINLSSAWIEAPERGNSGENFFRKIWGLGAFSDQELEINWSNLTGTNVSIPLEEKRLLEKAQTEPENYRVTVVPIPGAVTDANLIEFQLGEAYYMHLYAHKEGNNRYEVKGTLRKNPSEQEKDAMRQVLLSFKILP